MLPGLLGGIGGAAQGLAGGGGGPSGVSDQGYNPVQSMNIISVSPLEGIAEIVREANSGSVFNGGYGLNLGSEWDDIGRGTARPSGSVAVSVPGVASAGLSIGTLGFIAIGAGVLWWISKR